MDLIDEGLSFLTNDQKILGDIEANNAFFNNLDVSDKNQSNIQFKFVRFISIFDRILTIYEDSNQQLTKIVDRITMLPCFSCFIKLLT